MCLGFGRRPWTRGLLPAVSLFSRISSHVAVGPCFSRRGTCLLTQILVLFSPGNSAGGNPPPHMPCWLLRTESFKADAPTHRSGRKESFSMDGLAGSFC